MKRKSLGLGIAVALSAAMLTPTLAFADNIWNTDSGNWSDAGSWQAAPTFGAGTVADLSQWNLTAAGTSTVDGGATVGILKIGDAGAAFSYNVNGGPLTMDNSAANAQINQTATSKGDKIDAAISVAGNGLLEINNDGANQLTVHGAVSGGSTLLLGGSGAGFVRFENMASQTFTQITHNTNTYQLTVACPIAMPAGGLTVTRNGDGQVTFEQTLSGTGNLVMVENNSNANSLRMGAIDIVGTIEHQGTGTRIDEINGSVGANVTTITQAAASSQLDIRGGTHNIGGTRSLINNGGSPLNLKQSTAGTGTLVLQNNSSTSSGVSTAEGTLAHNGDVVNNGIGSGSATIKSNVSASITTITQNSSTSQLNIYDGSFTVNAGGTTVINNGGARIDFKANTAGTGDLILRNNTSVNDAIYLKEKVWDNAGQIINSGTGIGRVILTSNSKIGVNVTALVQNSATSMFLIQSDTSNASHLFAGDIIVDLGTMSTTRADLIDDGATVKVAASGATLNLNYSGTDIVNILKFGGVALTPGVYDSGNTTFITGNGKLNVLAIPEPASMALIGLGAIAMIRRRA